MQTISPNLEPTLSNGPSLLEQRVVRIAPLVRQPRRRDGALEFVALLAVLVVTCAASLAMVRGAPVARPAPAPAPAPASTQAPAPATIAAPPAAPGG